MQAVGRGIYLTQVSAGIIVVRGIDVKVYHWREMSASELQFRQALAGTLSPNATRSP